MTVIKINAITVPEGSGDELARRFAARAGAVDNQDGFEGFESTVSIAHLENRLAATLTLEARDEFRLCLFMYAKRLGAEGLRGKVEELLNSLLGGMLQGKTAEEKKGGGRGWYGQDDELCGWDRRELLKGVVMILGM